MAIFEKKHYGKPILQLLSNYIIYNQTHGDVKEIAEKHGYNPLTLTAIVRRNRNLTENNSEMVAELFRRCIQNYNNNTEIKDSINHLILKAI